MEKGLTVAKYARRKRVLRRRKIVWLSQALGWQFLKFGEALPAASCLLIGISLDARRDFSFLDVLRARPELWENQAVCLFHIEKPYILPLPRPVGDTPYLAVFQAGKRVHIHEGDDAFRFLMRA
ncbi:MAG: hypothetical protein P8018_03805 [Acidobacteriota bacterium]